MKLAKRNSCKILFLAVLLFVTACKENKSDEDKLVRIYVENLIVEETHKDNPEILKGEKAKLFQKFKTTEKEFESNLSSLGNDKEAWERFFTKTRLLLDDLRKSGAVN
ncbi:MAG: hypothetical protein WCZ90_05400 [Melioribacteraceae bacterium]